MNSYLEKNVIKIQSMRFFVILYDCILFTVSERN